MWVGDIQPYENGTQTKSKIEPDFSQRFCNLDVALHDEFWLADVQSFMAHALDLIFDVSHRSPTQTLLGRF